MSDTDDAIDELYALPVEEFTAARNALAARLKKDGSKAEAEQVKRLAKPTVSAWVMNQLHRERASELDKLVQAGEAVRDAQSGALRGGGGDELRDASRAQREAQSRLMRAAAEILEAGGHAASAATLDRVSISLQALAATGWGDAQPGRLERDLEPPGFDALAGLLASTPPKQTRPSTTTRADKSKKGEVDVEVSYEGDALASAAAEQERARRAEAEAALEQAKKRAKKLARDAEEAEKTKARAEERSRALRDEAADARRRAEEAQERADAAAQKAEAAAEEVRAAKRSAAEAEREVAAAERALEE